jgi:DNA helicase-2/ATP-dependent DNA helicase PcrA
MTQTVKSAPYLYDLNPEQRSAALQTEGPLLVLAGAGSGKTKTLVHRIVHLLRGREVPPDKIVVVTFTNRAAEEMRERVREFAGKEARGVTISTFHALGVRILRAHGKRLGLPDRFAVYSVPDQMAALKTAASEISIDDDRFDLKRVLRQISEWKTRRVSPEGAAREVREGKLRGNRHDDYAVLSAGTYARYEEVLRASGAVDFDDLLLLPVRLLEEDEEVRLDLWRRWQYLMIDEYQDTNAVQLDLARHLAGPRRNLCVVGDDDQSIYAFRGADLENILEFERHFPGARIVTLEQNYRSTRRILAAANAVIAANPHRHPKELRTENSIGAPIDYYEHENEEAEAEAVAKEISLRRYTQNARWGEFAILYRTNTQARPLEEALRNQNIPYRVIGGTSFFERKEVADAIAYLRTVANPRDEIGLRRIINYPTRGIGRTTILRIAEVAQERGVPFIDLLEAVGGRDGGAAPDDGARADAAEAGVTESAGGGGQPGEAIEGGAEIVGTAAVRSIGEFLALLAEARDELRVAEAAAASGPPGAGQPPLAHWAEAFFRELRLEEAIRSDPRNARSADMRVDNLRDLVGAIARYERRIWAAAGTSLEDQVEGVGEDENWTPPTLGEALARIALAEIENDEEDEREDDAVVTLMTLHSAKGLEFNDVFIVGLEEEILPHARSLADAESADSLRAMSDPLAEERRLFYVGITRARKRLTLSLCRARGKGVGPGGEPAPVLPSRFLEAIPKDLLQIKTVETILSPEESAELKKNFFADMRALFSEGGDAE